MNTPETTLARDLLETLSDEVRRSTSLTELAGVLGGIIARKSLVEGVRAGLITQQEAEQVLAAHIETWLLQAGVSERLGEEGTRVIQRWLGDQFR